MAGHEQGKVTIMGGLRSLRILPKGDPPKRGHACLGLFFPALLFPFRNKWFFDYVFVLRG